jgi:hypothetical protein
LWRGYTGILTRTAVGSAAQLSTFSSCKGFLINYDPFRESLFLTALFSSVIAGFFCSLFMTPFDTVATRIFNQGKWNRNPTGDHLFELLFYQESMPMEGGFSIEMWRIVLSKLSQLKVYLDCIRDFYQTTQE